MLGITLHEDSICQVRQDIWLDVGMGARVNGVVAKPDGRNPGCPIVSLVDDINKVEGKAGPETLRT